MNKFLRGKKNLFFTNHNKKYFKIFVEFAHQNYKYWVRNVNQDVKVALGAPLLHRDDNGNFHVNFDPKINEITRTAKYFERIGEEYDVMDWNI